MHLHSRIRRIDIFEIKLAWWIEKPNLSSIRFKHSSLSHTVSVRVDYTIWLPKPKKAVTEWSHIKVTSNTFDSDDLKLASEILKTLFLPENTEYRVIDYVICLT